MRRSGLLVSMLAAASLIAWNFGSQASAADAKAEITELEHKFAATTSADEAMTYFTTSEDLVMYDTTTPREFDGTAAVRANFQNAFNAFKNIKIEFISLHVIPDEKLAAAASVQHMTATDKSGKPLDLIFRQTDVWRKEKGGWKIVHAHISFPTDMASGKADMQSK